MKKITRSKLQLHTETVRALADKEGLRQIVGGQRSPSLGQITACLCNSAGACSTYGQDC